MGHIAQRTEALRRAARIRNHLLATTTLCSAPSARVDDDRAADRFAVGKAFLGRDPFYLTNPFTGQVMWVESEPDDWREFFRQRDEDAQQDDTAKGRMH